MGKMILIVDDEPDVLTTVSFRLKKSGYAVTAVDSGEAALEFLQTNRPDLLLLDLRMPGIDGYEICRRVKAHESWKNIPVFLFSASTSMTQDEKFRSLSAEDYVVKPFEADELLRKIKNIIG